MAAAFATRKRIIECVSTLVQRITNIPKVELSHIQLSFCQLSTKFVEFTKSSVLPEFHFRKLLLYAANIPLSSCDLKEEPGLFLLRHILFRIR